TFGLKRRTGPHSEPATAIGVLGTYIKEGAIGRRIDRGCRDSRQTIMARLKLPPRSRVSLRSVEGNCYRPGFRAEIFLIRLAARSASAAAPKPNIAEHLRPMTCASMKLMFISPSATACASA